MLLTLSRNSQERKRSNDFFFHTCRLVFTQGIKFKRFWDNCPRGKLPPNPKTQGKIFLEGNCLVVLPTLKLTLTLTQTPTLTRSQFYLGGGCNCLDTSLNKINVFCLIVTDYDITKKLMIKKKLRHKYYVFQYSKTYDITVVEHK